MTLCPHWHTAGEDEGQIGAAPYHGHVTLDWDGTTQKPQKFYLFRGSPEGDSIISCVHWRKSSSRRGLHILVCLVKDISPLEKFLFRMWNHDDIWRLTYDIIRYDESQSVALSNLTAERYAEGTLFELKDGKGVAPWQGV